MILVHAAAGKNSKTAAGGKYIGLCAKVTSPILLKNWKHSLTKYLKY